MSVEAKPTQSWQVEVGRLLRHQETVDPVRALPFGGIGESIAAIGVGDKSRKDKMEVGLEGGVTGEVIA